MREEGRHKIGQLSPEALCSLFDQAPGFMAVLEGPDHRYAYSNAANNRLLGVDDIVGRRAFDEFPELVGQGFRDILDRVYVSGEPFIAHDLPMKVKRADGSDREDRVLSLIYQPIRDANGEIIGILVDGHDVTEQHVSHQRVQALQSELVHLSRASAMSTMASTIAHEINQPLSVIANYMTAARRIGIEHACSKELDLALAGAATAAAHAGEIIRLLRRMARHGRVEANPFPLHAATIEAVRLTRLTHPGISVSCKFGPGMVAMGDRVQYQQVLLNLMQNACEAAGDAPCKVSIESRAYDTMIHVCVADNGPGIASDLLPDIFDALTTTKAHGIGVGLSICRTIVEANGGSITAANRSRGGAKICFTLPSAS